MNLKGYAPLLDYKYWLNQHPVPLGPSLVGGILAFFGWCILLAAVLWLLSRWFKSKDKLKASVFSRFAGLLFSTGALGLLVLFLTYEQLPLLGMRFWFLLVAVYFVARLVATVTYTVRDYPAAKAELNERQRLGKWLPNKKASRT